MTQRNKLEKEEGKLYSEPGVRITDVIQPVDFFHDYSQVSDRMKSLNARFAYLHGLSSLANLVAVIALGFHGLWIGNFGVKVY
jgi:hypothetical protein